MKVALTSAHVDDPQKAFTFYTEGLGFLPRMYVPEASIASAYRTGIYEAGLPAIVFGVADAQREYERLSALGVVSRGEPAATGHGTLALLEDSWGNLIPLHQAP